MIKLNDEQRVAIARDPRIYKQIAADYGVDQSRIAQIKRDYGVAGCARHYRRASEEPAKKPLPQRHYKPSWAEEKRS